jgi:hypothetical protein
LLNHVASYTRDPGAPTLPEERRSCVQTSKNSNCRANVVRRASRASIGRSIADSPLMRRCSSKCRLGGIDGPMHFSRSSSPILRRCGLIQNSRNLEKVAAARRTCMFPRARSAYVRVCKAQWSRVRKARYRDATRRCAAALESRHAARRARSCAGGP